MDPDPRVCNGRSHMARAELGRGFVPCYRQNVMGTTIPSGSRAGARPCGSCFSSSVVYCYKCYARYRMDGGEDPEKVLQLVSTGNKQVVSPQQRCWQAGFVATVPSLW